MKTGTYLFRIDECHFSLKPFKSKIPISTFMIDHFNFGALKIV